MPIFQKPVKNFFQFFSFSNQMEINNLHFTDRVYQGFAKDFSKVYGIL